MRIARTGRFASAMVMTAMASSAAILDVRAPLPTASVAIPWQATDDEPGWLESEMIADYEATPVSDQIAQLRRARDLVSSAAGPNGIEPFDPWQVSPHLLPALSALFPEETALARRAASHAYKAGNALLALEILRRTVASDSYDADVAELYLGILVTENRLVLATDFAGEATARFPDSPVIWFNAACAYARLNNVDEVIHHLGIALQMDWPQLFYHLSDADFDGVRLQPRFRNLEQSIQLNLFGSILQARPGN